jgi:hypothetical protein
MLNMIPLPYKLLAVVALLVGVFFYGYTKGSVHAKVELQRFATKHAEQVAQLEQENQEVSNKVVTKYVDKVKTIREKEYVYRDIAKTVVPSQHVMSHGWVYTHDISVGSNDADTTRASDASASGITDTTALIGIIGNYSRCQQNAQQLILLQQWITDNKTAVDVVNAKASK